MSGAQLAFTMSGLGWSAQPNQTAGYLGQPGVPPWNCTSQDNPRPNVALFDAAAPRKQAKKSATLNEKAWAPHKARVLQLHIEEGRLLKEVARIMEGERGFKATERQYRTRITQWNKDKNVKASEMQAIVRKRQYRKLEEPDKSPQCFRVRGVIVNHQKIDRWMKRQKISDTERYGPDVERATPSVISCQTVSYRMTCSPNSRVTVLSEPLSPVEYTDVPGQHNCGQGQPDKTVQAPLKTPDQDEVAPGCYRSSVPDVPCSPDSTYQCQDGPSAADEPGTVNDLLQRLSKHSKGEEWIMTPQDSRGVFNDLQRILSSEQIAWDCEAFQRCDCGRLDIFKSSEAETFLTKLRNLINLDELPIIIREPGLTRTKTLRNGSRDISRIRKCDSQPVFRQQSSWMTPYGRVHVTFWSRSVDINGQVSTLDSRRSAFSAQIVVLPIRQDLCSARVVFDFASNGVPFGLSTTLNFVPMVSNDSEVFQTASKGTDRQLIRLFEEGHASINDHDEQGRSLLNYAIDSLNVSVCTFLVQKKTDVNAIEVDKLGYPGPVFAFFKHISSEAPEEDLLVYEALMKMMLEHGADIALEIDVGNRFSVFSDQIHSASASTLKSILDHSAPLVNIDQIPLGFGAVSPLLLVAEWAGYRLGESFQILEKAMVLLKHNSSVACRDTDANTILHIVLSCPRRFEDLSESHARDSERLWRWKLSVITPKNMLILFISAGADVFATNRFGETPSMVAADYDRIAEWEEALQFCGYDVEAVRDHHHSDIKTCTSQHPTPSKTFEECCEYLGKIELPAEGDWNDHLWETVDVGPVPPPIFGMWL